MVVSCGAFVDNILLKRARRWPIVRGTEFKTAGFSEFGGDNNLKPN